jgi:TolB-like protein/Flp pilus assembly protein TadD
MDTAPAAARRTSSVSLLIRRLARRPLRTSAAIAMLALALTIVIFGWRWWASRSETPISAPIKTLAVLPFANVVNDPQVEYLADGFTESVIDSLSQAGLRVMARSTVFTYKGREVDPRQVGEKLKVRAVLTGRVSQRGDTLTVAAELVDVADGARLWGKQYNRKPADVFAIQEEIAQEIAEALRLKLGGESTRQLAKRYTTNTDAYMLYRKGRYHYYQFTQENEIKARDYFYQAIALDPNYALAYAGIADIYTDFSGQYMTPGEAMPRAKEAASKALALDDNLAEAHHSLAMISFMADWDWAAAEREFKRAIELNPNWPVAHTDYGNFLALMGRFEEARVEAQRGRELDPLSAFAIDLLSQVYFYERQYDRTIEHCYEIIEFNPGYIWAYRALSRSLRQQGRYQEAIAECQKGLAIQRHDSLLADLAYLYSISGRRAAALKILAELNRAALRRRVSPVYLARIHIGLGENARALDLLRQGYEERSDHMLALLVDPLYDGLRADPQFIDLLRRIGLTR